MDLKANQSDIITRFLLGELSEDQRREVEERFLSDNEFFERILSAEDALIDQYLFGTLSKQEHSSARALFESSSEQAQSVEVTKQIISLVRSHVAGNEDSTWAEPSGTHIPVQTEDKEIERMDPFPRWLPPYVVQGNGGLLWVVGLVSVILLGSGLIYMGFKQRNLKNEQTTAEQTARQANESLSAETSRTKQLTEELESERQKRQRAEDLLAQFRGKQILRVASVILRPRKFDRSGSSDLATLRAGASEIRIQLVLDTDRRYEKYSVWITSFDGREVWNNSSLPSNKVKQRKLTVVLPSKLLGYDDYKIELRGAPANGNFEHLADYAFRFKR